MWAFLLIWFVGAIVAAGLYSLWRSSEKRRDE